MKNKSNNLWKKRGCSMIMTNPCKLGVTLYTLPSVCMCLKIWGIVRQLNISCNSRFAGTTKGQLLLDTSEGR